MMQDARLCPLDHVADVGHGEGVELHVLVAQHLADKVVGDGGKDARDGGIGGDDGEDVRSEMLGSGG